MEKAMSLKDVKRLGEELLTSKASINNAPALLSLLSRALEAPSHSYEECLLQALLSLQAFFSSLLSSGELCPHALKNAQQTLQDTAREPAHQAQAVYLSWLWDKYSAFVNLLLELMVSSSSVPYSVQVASIDALMEFVRQEKNGDFSNRVYNMLCSTLATSKDLNIQSIDHLATGYFKYIDVCCHTCINLRKLIVTYHRPKQQGMETTSDGVMDEKSLQSLMSNVCNILTRIVVPKATGKDSKVVVMERWSKSEGGKNDREPGDDKSQLANIKMANEKVKEHQDAKKLKAKISRVWLTFLRIPLSASVYEKALGNMHKTIIPNLTNPLLLSDFLTNSYNKGGLISVMALSGLFLLITEHGLEYPEFYNKLYALLEPSIFIAKYRARFFELLDLSLKSPLLPSYLAAAFAKKLGRMALKSPPSGALIVIAIVHNLLRRHPSINCLVHRNYDNLEAPLPDSQENVLNEAELAANGGESEGQKSAREGLGTDLCQQPAIERLGTDPFLVSESDPAKSNALSSSLWEVETLRRHYCPPVSRFVASLEADLTVRAKTTELAIKDFSSASYATIFSEEVKRRMKQVPLAFYKSTPTTLFPTASGSEPPGLVEFPGWSFGGKQSSAGKEVGSGKNHDEADGGVKTTEIREEISIGNGDRSNDNPGLLRKKTKTH